MYKYKTNFTLLASVNDLKAARKYLNENLAQYLTNRRSDGECDFEDGHITSIKIVLDDEDSGHIEVESTTECSPKELELISSYLQGQCADGIGEGFEQQGFATIYWCEYKEEELNHISDCEWCHYYEECPTGGEPEFIMASFDWQTNEYPLTRVDEF